MLNAYDILKDKYQLKVHSLSLTENIVNLSISVWPFQHLFKKQQVLEWFLHHKLSKLCHWKEYVSQKHCFPVT